jgi:hypothetical protein
MYVCVYVRIYTHTYTYIRTCIYICTCVCVCIYMHMCVCVHIYAYVCVCAYICMCVCVCIHISNMKVNNYHLHPPCGMKSQKNKKISRKQKTQHLPLGSSVRGINSQKHSFPVTLYGKYTMALKF